MAWWTGARPLLWAVLLAAFLAPRPALAQTVTEIRVLGNAQAEESLVFQSFGVKVGDVYQVDRVRQGIRNLYRQGLFRDVQIDVERVDEGLILTVRVDENPALLRIRYDGADKLKKKNFDEVVQLVPGQIVSRKAVAQATKDILALYHEKGYLLATVDADLRGDQRADLTFTIDEGKKVQVAKIRFEGNEHVSEDDLRGVLKTKEDRWWRGGDFKEDVFAQDRVAIVSRLGRDGYVDARVTDVRKTFSEDKEKLFLDIVVSEGPQYRVGSIELDHGGIIPENEIRASILLKEGEPFDTVSYDETIGNLYSLYQEQGFIYASIDARKVPRGDQVIDVVYEAVEREAAHINRILITGNTKTKEQVIRRELRAAPGDVFKRSRVIRSQREVFQLGFFNDIQLDSRTADRETGDIDLVIDVEERQTGTASLGAGVNSQAGLTGFLQLSQNNFLGKGQVISLRGEFGRFREYDLSFTEPWLLGTPTSAGFDVFDARRRFNEYTEKRTGGTLRLGRPFPWLDYTRVSWRYSNARYTIDAEPGFENQIGDAIIDPETGLQSRDPDTGEPLRTGVNESRVSSTTLAFYRNSLDSPFFPTRGSATRLTNEFGGAFLQGDEDFYLMELSTQSYFPTVGKFVLSLGGRAGFLHGLSGANEVPFWKRFRLGGISTYGLRGYDDYDVVPNQSEPSVGGRSMFIMTTELRYPVFQAVQALAFFDAGNTWVSPGEMNLTDLRKGAGLGIRLDVPMVGQLGFDYGYGFDRSEQEGGPGWEFHFQIGGQSF